jgi:hypothetical protein
MTDLTAAQTVQMLTAGYELHRAAPCKPAFIRAGSMSFSVDGSALDSLLSSGQLVEFAAANAPAGQTSYRLAV